MNQEQKEFILESIKEDFKSKSDFFDYELDKNFSLFLTQLDLFKVISGLIIGFAGIGYFVEKPLYFPFFVIAMIFAFVTLIGTISYTKESIDEKAGDIQKERKYVLDRYNEKIQASTDAINDKDWKTYIDYLNKTIKETGEEIGYTSKTEQLIYAGEIFTFLFYNSIIFLLLSILTGNPCYPLLLTVILFIIVLLFSYFLSFKLKLIKIIDSISKQIK